MWCDAIGDVREREEGQKGNKVLNDKKKKNSMINKMMMVMEQMGDEGEVGFVLIVEREGR